jgi:hypothetical protein
MFEQRARGSEFLDGPDCDRRLALRSFRFMRTVNRIGGGTRAVRDFLARELRNTPDHRPMRILDLGAGGGDIPLSIVRWARARGHRIEFTCIDHNADALEMARQAVDGEPIKLERADMFTYEPAAAFDYAIGSMVFHHFTDDDIDKLIEHLRRFVRKALLINDLRRCALNYAVCSVLSWRLDEEIRHDALLSIRRGFQPTDLTSLLVRHDPGPVVHTGWFCRITGVVRFDRDDRP